MDFNLGLFVEVEVEVCSMAALEGKEVTPRLGANFG